jgi:5-methylthioadenosine/S-adenosylhomocysteine deaminase
MVSENRVVIQDVLLITLDPNNRIGKYSIVIQNGLIKDLSPTPIACTPFDVVLDGRNKVALPGFFNGHIHADVLLARGLGDGLTLHEQQQDSLIGRRQWFRKELTSEARRLGRMLQYAEALKGGTTFLCDFPFWLDAGDDIAGPFEETGIKGAVAFDFRQDFLTSTVRDIEEIKAISGMLNAFGILPLLQGPSEESFEAESLLRLKSIADKLSLAVQLHLAETRHRCDIMQEKFGMSSVGFLHNLGFLDKNVIGSHGVFLDGKDLKTLASVGTSIVNSPTAEMKIADGAAPVARMLSNGVTVGLGTDGALWNDCSDMFREMKCLVLLQRLMNGASAMSAEQALRAATIEGARTFGVNRLYGSIEKGKRASIVLVNALKSHLIPIYAGAQCNVMQNLVSCASAGDVDTVLVDGEIVVQGGKLTRLDEDALITHAQEVGTSIFAGLN